MAIRFSVDDVINTVGNNTNSDQDPFAVSAQVRQEAEARDVQQQLQTDRVDLDTTQQRLAAEHTVASNPVRVAPAVNSARPADSTPMYSQVPVNLRA
jgi:hypothetical protein